MRRWTRKNEAAADRLEDELAMTPAEWEKVRARALQNLIEREAADKEYLARQTRTETEVLGIVRDYLDGQAPSAVLPLVCNQFGIDPSLVRDGGRKAVVCRARRVAAHLLRTLHRYSYPEIAEALGMQSHNSAIYAVKSMGTNAA